ncbi:MULTISPECIES: tryptophan--tRNA ligase [Nitrosomonas]|uniref:Tryptophan--tRNA ligase n=2 Tax=Nitrosomonas eutropha TaxID=916 RepID=A0ABX5MCZ3_9PROT|nr:MULTISPECIES: tryptophan--tRNA ligase [Nitrosomonas]ABI60265.1 tryptophanyl-tRNA synthetase [Nitrosomonas eutropha C91]MXS80640.1 tryptophan--tRNA ligase [Nitrosomonas sp. GH22]PXV81694.1 tryptophanyl-tRNA synthetase [Nitrosomonas eutropha]SCX11821.1 tryptophanyl-tRNA synthetase [Nitrosomonas eutropha]SDW73389.1 tryptophanyl-tRNA synthetase [Nitrosomonas eutropha]
MFVDRVLSGMRPTGNLHLGHYHGVLKNWLALQQKYECLFFVADWHALTTHYDSPEIIEQHSWNMVVDWLAAGVDPAQATLFIQSKVPAHAELYLLLSMITPLGWLERVPTYKDQQEKLVAKDLSTYGFLGYPLLQSADILVYRANLVPVGEDQAPHLEFTREVSRRFNHIFGKEPDFENKVTQAIKRMGSKKGKLYGELRNRYQEQGDENALSEARLLLKGQQNLSMDDRERLSGYLEGRSKVILPEPQTLLTKASKMPGLDGQKMSKSYGNTIGLREDVDSIARKIRTMPTDPARVRRNDPGNPEKCPVWQFHQLYSSEDARKWVWQGCTTAGIGCLECKQPIIQSIREEQAPILERAKMYQEDPAQVKKIVAEGCEKANQLAEETMRDVRAALGIGYP